MNRDKGYFDGACEPVNPGGSIGWGFILLDKWGAILKQDHGFVSAKHWTSNNVAEYMAAGAAVKAYKELGREGPLYLHGDSKLVVKQMRLEWNTNESKLYYPVYVRLVELLATCEFKIDWTWIPRKDNSIADELSKKSLVDQGVELTDWSKRRH